MKKQFALMIVLACAFVSFAGITNAEENVVTTTTAVTTISQDSSVPKTDLFVGKRGDDVKALQEFLFGKGFLDKDSRTGYFGGKTKSALVKYQKANGLPGVGRFGPATRTKMREHLDGKPVGGQRDEHGCLGPAGYTWDESLKACVRPWEKPTSMLEKPWSIKTIDGKAVTGLTLKVDDGNVSAKACNTMFGKATVDNKEMTIKAPTLASTMMACDNGLMDQDTILNQTLANGAKITFDFNANPVTMTLVGGNHTLVFSQK